MRWGVTVACFLTANLATADGVMIGGFSGGPSSAKIALVAAGEDLLAYVCSADHSFNETYGRWYRGDVAENGDFTLENAGFILSGKISGDRVTGELGGKHAKSQAFAAALVAPDGAAGLFRVQELESDGKYTAGWIVCEDGETVGTVEADAPAADAKAPKSPRRRIATAPASRTANPSGRVGARDSKGERVGPDGVRRALRAGGAARRLVSPLPGDKLRGIVKDFDFEKRTVTLEVRGKEIVVDIGARQVVVRGAKGDDVAEPEANAKKREPLTRVGKVLRDRINKFFADGNEVTISVKGKSLEFDVAKPGAEGDEKAAKSADAEPKK